jgi:hypothetical protein
MRVEPALNEARTRSRLAEHRFFVFMSVLLLATALVGFGPNTFAILAGTRAVRTPTFLFDAHAVLMFAWLLLLVAQTSLNGLGHHSLHQRLGRIAFVVVPAMVVVMILVSTINLWTRNEWPAQRYNVLLLQIRAIVIFPLLMLWAMSVRRSSPATHKRLMIIATVVLLDAAIARVSWLHAASSRYELMSVYQLSVLAPLALYDIWSTGRVHRANIIGIGLFAFSAVVVNSLWGTAWWIQAAPRLLRISN